MRPSVLVIYASRHRSTEGVANRIASRIGEHGITATVSEASSVPELDRIDAVVLGSPVYGQRWLPEAEELARTHVDDLAGLPVWLFSVGTFGDDKPLIGPLMKREPKGIENLCAALQAREYRVFAGVIDRHQWPYLSRLFFHTLGGRLGDNRDWGQIDAWADEIAGALTASGPRGLAVQSSGGVSSSPCSRA